MSNASPTQDRSLPPSASVSRKSSVYFEFRDDTQETLDDHPTATPTVSSQSRNQTDEATNDKKDTPTSMTWADTVKSAQDAHVKAVIAGTILSRAERFQQILPEHRHLWGATANTALATKTKANNEILDAIKYANSNFSREDFPVKMVILDEMSEIGQGERDKANSYLRGQAEGRLSERELSIMEEHLARRSVSMLSQSVDS